MTHAADIIFDQIKTIDPAALADWGALFQPKLRMKKDGMEGLRIKSSLNVAWKGFIDIMYDRGADAYIVEFVKVRKTKVTVCKRVENVYVDMLVQIIDGVVLKGDLS